MFTLTTGGKIKEWIREIGREGRDWGEGGQIERGYDLN